jgi:chondroitin AC lyase
MERKVCGIMVLIAAGRLAAACQGADAAPTEDDIRMVKARIRKDLLPADEDTGPAKTLIARGRRWAASLRPDGSWEDIDYRDQTYSGWEPAEHVRRLQDMARSWRLGAGGPALKAKLLKALDCWLRRNPRCGSYWWNAIGVPLLLYPTLFLLEDELPDPSMKAGIDILGRGYHDKKWDFHGHATGQNLVWIASLQVYRSVLLGDAEAAAHHFRRIAREIVVATGRKEGIKADNSFWQHGAILYSGGYGRGFSMDCARLMYLAHGTRFAFPESKVALLSRSILDGQVWMCRGPTFDYSAIGREIARKRGGRSGSVGHACAYMAKLASPRRDEFDRAARALGDGETGWEGEPSGNRHFWRADFMVHRRPAFYVSVKMVSRRTVGTESGNGENLRGYHLPHGCTYIMPRGDEYQGIFPFWNWRRVPGVTCEQAPAPLPRATWGNGARGSTSFVGGVSDDTHGVAAFDYARLGVRARKTWFCFGRIVVCLGAGIACDGESPVVTSINQCWLKGPVTTSAEKPDRDTPLALSAPAWLHHDGVGYVFPDAAAVRLDAGPTSGNWHRINRRYPDKKETADVFSLWIEHGAKPTAADYSYVLLPGVDRGATARFARKSPVTVLKNTPALQAVHDAERGLTGAVFYNPGKLDADHAPIAVDQACIVLLRHNGDERRIAVAKPDSGRKPKPLRVTVAGKTLTIELPAGELAGKSVVRDL